MSFSKSFAVFTAFITWFALGLQLYIMIDNVPENGLTVLTAITRFFLYFTILTNLLVAVCLTIRAAAPTNQIGHYFAKPSTLGAIAVYIFIVGLIYNLVLRNQWTPTGNQRLADELLHVIVPIFFIMYWFLFAPKYGLLWTHALRWLTFPGFYLIYALVRGSIEEFYPYPFLDVKTNGAGKVVFNSFLVLIAFIAVGLLIIFIAKKITASRKKT